MLQFRKNQVLLTKLDDYIKLTENMLDEFHGAFDYALKKGIDEHFDLLAKKAHQLESNADDIRRVIEMDVFGQSLLPESREDLLEVLERIDLVPSRAESILNMFVTQRTELIPEIRKNMKELVHLSCETFKHVLDATRDCFGRMERVRELSRLIDNNESLGDRLERKMIQTIYSQKKLSSGDKLTQKEFVLQVGRICDLCESAKDRLVICSVKRQV